ncbi:MAG: non-hydrolyzing UDP-N-acetylglucosamine 2-epimerase [Deltaproteobacteria bacterium]
MKILTVIGARPQFVKAAVVSRAIIKYNASSNTKITEIIVDTGQHYDINMAKIFFEQLSIPKPNYSLGVGSGNHGEQTGEILKKVEQVIFSEKPDVVMVYGDTNSTLAGALAASKLLIPVIHVEAGLRSFNMAMPEEQNRILTDHISTMLFCPTETAVKNLKDEGIKENFRGKKVANTGDVMYDAVLYNSDIASKKSNILDILECKEKKYILSTIHRAENTNEKQVLIALLSGLAKTGEKIILPVHPRTKKFIKQYNIDICKNINIIDPVGYLDMLLLEKNAKIIATDSGGVQKEAFFFKIPCITLRNETEWIETVESGWNQLVGSSPEKIVEAVSFINDKKQQINDSKAFGDGHAGEKIIDFIIKTSKK